LVDTLHKAKPMSTASSGNSNLPLDPTIALGQAMPADTTPPRILPAADSPAVKFAIEVCGEIFPGSPVDMEVMYNPEDPERTWYCLNVEWAGGVRDCIERSSLWYTRFETRYGEFLPDFVISATPV
jgi:hypothetical protein